jgi:MFS transporter, AAHS family, 4-hydroxybenzoate transporter
VIDVREEIAGAPLGRYHALIAVLVALAVFFDGYDTFNAAYVIHYVMQPWHLLPGQAGFLVSSGLIGFMIGSLVQGKFSDRFGRRATLLAALWIATLFSFGTATLANSFLTFCGLRLLTGIGLGALLPVGVTYMNEYAPRRSLNWFSLWGWALGFAAGGVAASAVGIYLTPALGWQALYYGGSLSVVLALVCHMALPESLQYAAMRGKTGDIARVLARLNPANAARYQAADAQFVFPEPSDKIASISLILSPRYLRTTLSVWAAAFCVLFGIFGLTGWVPTVMIQRGETFAASFGFGALIQVMAFIGSLLCGYIADRHHQPRGAMMVWWLGGALSVGTLALFNNHILNFICVGAAGFCILGGQNVLNNFTGSIYDTEVRGTGVGMMLGVGRLGGILGPFATGIIQQMAPGAMGLFTAIAAAVLLGAVAIAFAQPRRYSPSTRSAF